MELLKKVILKDLEIHFGKPLDNKHLYSCLVYDLVFVHCVIGPLFIITWRGTWHNADTLFDEVIFDGDFKISSLVSLIIGLVLSTCVILLQHEIKAIALKQNKFINIIISRCFTIARFYFDLLMWKGIWGLYNYIVHDNGKGTWQTSISTFIGSSLILCLLRKYKTNNDGFTFLQVLKYTSLSCFLGASLMLCLVRTYKGTICTPLGCGIDRVKTYINVPTVLDSQGGDPLMERLKDVAVTMPTLFVGIHAFYGLWTGLDHFFEQSDQNGNRALNGAICYGSGFGCAVLVFFLQFLFAWLYHKSKFANLKATENSTRFKILRLIGYDVVIMIALIGNVASFRGFWNILDVYFLPSDQLTSRLICQILGIFYLFLFYAGTSLHGGVTKDSAKVMIPNYFLTYLLAQKQSPKI